MSRVSRLITGYLTALREPETRRTVKETVNRQNISGFNNGRDVLIWVCLLSLLIGVSPAWGLSVEPPVIILPPDGNQQINVTGGTPPYTYSSTNPNAFQVDQTGLVQSAAPEGNACSAYFEPQPAGKAQHNYQSYKCANLMEIYGLTDDSGNPITGFGQKYFPTNQTGLDRCPSAPSLSWDWVVPYGDPASELFHFSFRGWWVYEDGSKLWTTGISNCYGINPTGQINIQDDNNESLNVPVLNGSIRQDTSNGGPKSCLTPGAKGRPVNVTTGNMYYVAPQDTQVRGRGPELNVTRVYNSQFHLSPSP